MNVPQEPVMARAANISGVPILAAVVLAGALSQGACNLELDEKTACRNNQDCLPGFVCHPGASRCMPAACSDGCGLGCCGDACCPDGFYCASPDDCRPFEPGPFSPSSISASAGTDGLLVLAVSDIDAPAACALSQNTMGPTGLSGRRILVQVPGAVEGEPGSMECRNTSASIEPGCSMWPDGSSPCAQYQLLDDYPLGGMAATSGTITLEQRQGECLVDVSLEFPGGERAAFSFALAGGRPFPWCML